ncbi:hypothetical protein BS17DRAFT_784019 [Gyrodon lividus]|nr:hypothetical protein BS17DRAFT_784019 [Gyrodon lividus]
MESFFDYARDVRTVTYFEVSISILFIFDYFYLLEDELSFIWDRRDWGLGKALFVPTRYIPFAIIPVTLSSSFSAHANVDTCETLLYFMTVLDALAITLSEVIFGLRAYAMWNRNRMVLVISCCTITASMVALILIFLTFLPSVTFGEPPLPIISGCYKTGASSVLFASFVVIMLSEAVTTSLTLYRAYRHFRHAPNVLIQNLTRDGVFYCLSMFAMSVVNVLVIFLLPIQYSELLDTYQAVMHTILATRMQLHLRKLDRHTCLADSLTDESLSSISFKGLDVLDDA